MRCLSAPHTQRVATASYQACVPHSAPSFICHALPIQNSDSSACAISTQQPVVGGEAAQVIFGFAPLVHSDLLVVADYLTKPFDATIIAFVETSMAAP